MRWPGDERTPQQEAFHEEVGFYGGMLYFGFPSAAAWHLPNPVEVSAERFILMEAVRYRTPFEDDCNK